MKLAPLVVSPAAYFEMIMQPTFADIDPGFSGTYTSTLHDWTVMDNVPLDRGVPIINIIKQQNFLKRKDASCKTNWSTALKATTRKVTVDELYSAVEDCQDEFYVGALKDFRDQNARFRDYIMDSFKTGTNVDVLSNGYFGDTSRTDDPNGIWSWNKYDGVVKRINDAIDSGELPSDQVFTLPSGTITPQQAYDALNSAYNLQSDMMQSFADGDKSYYVDKRFAMAYADYLLSTGMNTVDSIMLIQNGVPVFRFKDIAIKVEPTWNPILKALNDGEEAHMLILTMRGNFVFTTNKSYGGGANLDQALRVWWSDDDEVWRQKQHLVAGAWLATERDIVFGMTNIE